MRKDTFILSECEKEKMDELKELTRLKVAETLGLKRGFEKETLETKKELEITNYFHSSSFFYQKIIFNFNIKYFYNIY